jgi:hypothetical protein
MIPLFVRSLWVLVQQIPTSPLTTQGGDLGLKCREGNLRNSKNPMFFRMKLASTREKAEESSTAKVLLM